MKATLVAFCLTRLPVCIFDSTNRIESNRNRISSCFVDGNTFLCFDLKEEKKPKQTHSNRVPFGWTLFQKKPSIRPLQLVILPIRLRKILQATASRCNYACIWNVCLRFLTRHKRPKTKQCCSHKKKNTYQTKIYWLQSYSTVSAVDFVMVLGKEQQRTQTVEIFIQKNVDNYFGA